VLFLQSKLFNELGIKSSVVPKKNNFILAIYADCYLYFINNITEFVSKFSCFNYKIEKSNIRNRNYSKDILALWQTGLYKKTDIARKLGCDRKTVHKWVRTTK